MNRRHTKSKSISTGIVISKITVCIVVLLICQSDGVKADEAADQSEYPVYEIFRQNFLVRGSDPQIKSPIGRLSLLKVENGSMRAVRFDHRFRSHERFRIAISSNRDGYLFIFHRSPSGKTHLLWPPKSMDANGKSFSGSKIRRGEIKSIPPGPGTFTFDSETGVEVFCITLSVSPEPPSFPPDGKMADDSQADKPNPQRPIVKILVRGQHGAVQERGVYYDPGIKDPDPSIYFSAKPGDMAESLSFEFALQHE